jgi:hypothetical protein
MWVEACEHGPSGVPEGKTNLVIPGSSLVLIKQTPRTKDRFLSQHMAFIHIIDVPYRDFLIFHMHICTLIKCTKEYYFTQHHHFINFLCAILSGGLHAPFEEALAACGYPF